MKFYSIVLALIFVLPLQAKSPDRTRVEEILQRKCMDCHSQQTQYPWYYGAPFVKGMIDADIRYGRAMFDIEESILKVEDEKEISKQTLASLEAVIKHDAMPPVQYKLAHWDKSLSKSDKQAILDWLGRINGKLIEALEEIQALNQAKVELGKQLFHDKRLSGDNSIACASCHDLTKGGTDQTQFSTGIDGRVGHMNSPTVYNAALNIKQFWDGRAEDLEAQAHGPVHNPIEMGSNWSEVLAKLRQDSNYVQSFKKVYGIKNSKAMTGDMIANAIAEFEKTLITTGSKFDQYLQGKAVLSTKERQGYELFKRYNCTSCHMGAAVGGQSFALMGVKKNYFSDRAQGLNGLKKLAISKEDNGRKNFTHNESDLAKFKVPTLRNVTSTHPYMHDGNVESLEEAVRIMAEYQVGKKLKSSEIELIVAFLRTL